MLVWKYTEGYVRQFFDTDKNQWIAQDFVAGDSCDYELDDGTVADDDLVHIINEHYLPYDMVQPSQSPTG